MASYVFVCIPKFIPNWKIGRKWLMHDVNKGMECFLGYTGKLDTFSVMEDMESSNEGLLTIVG
jgi:glucuronate isomerase